MTNMRSSNEHIPQLQLFSEASAPSEAAFYGVIIHCEVPGDKGQLGALSIGFPHPTLDEWVDEPIPLQDIADAQRRVYAKPEREPPAAKPRWKKRKDDRKENED